MPKRLQYLVLLASLAWPAAAAPLADTAPESIAHLIEQLGDDDYNRREAAAAALKSIGPAAVDALLSAAEMSTDLEVSLRARWIADAIPLELPHDPPEVTQLLERFKSGDAGGRVQAMRRLLRVDNDAGIEPLARIVRLDRSVSGSRLAAALLVREWRPDDPYWPLLRKKITAGAGTSERPAARFLRALVAFSEAAPGDKATIDETLVAAEAARADLGKASDDPTPAEPSDLETTILLETQTIFDRCLAQLLLAAGRRDAAIAAARQLLAEQLADRDQAVDGVVNDAVTTLVWATESGLPAAVDALADRTELVRDHAVLGFAAAAAERARGDNAKAEALAADAFEKTDGDFPARLQAAVMLAKWGCVEWATRCYKAIVEDPQAPVEQLSLAAIMYAEFLHDLEQDDEAAVCLGRLMGSLEQKVGANPVQIAQQLGRDPRSTKSRMHFFESCAAAKRGDAAARRTAAELAVAAYPKDVDALIALYALTDSSPEQKAAAVAKIKRAINQIDNEIQAVPDDANGYNEYAWLVANTEGDVKKATQYSKVSLARSFDNASYLDTLAHCRAAAGDYEAAIRTQSLARRQEPHNRTIQRNLARFEKRCQDSFPAHTEPNR
jgi:hypothetical protein